MGAWSGQSPPGACCPEMGHDSAARAGLDRGDHLVEGLARGGNEIGCVEGSRLRRAAAAEDEADAELSRDLEDHVRRIVPVTLRKKVMVIGRRRGAGKNELSKTDARSRAQRLLVDLMPIGIWHRAQPL